MTDPTRDAGGTCGWRHGRLRPVGQGCGFRRRRCCRWRGARHRRRRRRRDRSGRRRRHRTSPPMRARRRRTQPPRPATSPRTPRAPRRRPRAASWAGCAPLRRSLTALLRSGARPASPVRIAPAPPPDPAADAAAGRSAPRYSPAGSPGSPPRRGGAAPRALGYGRAARACERPRQQPIPLVKKRPDDLVRLDPGRRDAGILEHPMGQRAIPGRRVVLEWQSAAPCAAGRRNGRRPWPRGSDVRPTSLAPARATARRGRGARDRARKP